jgi:hypothetical protein
MILSAPSKEGNDMKCAFSAVMILTLFSSLTVAKDLKRLSLDDASSIGTTIQTDSKTKTEGKGSVRITTKHATTVCLGEVTDLDIENAKLTFSANVKSDLDGVAFLEMWAHVNGGQYFSRGMNDSVQGETDWKSIQTPFIFQRGQKPEKVVLNVVINGHGTVWIDDVVLARAPLN